MKRSSLLVLILISISAYAQDNFYYAFDTKINIQNVPDKFVLRISGEKIPDEITGYFTLDTKMDDHTYLITVTDPDYLDDIQNPDEVVSLQPSYVLDDGFAMYPTEEIVYTANEGVSDTEVNEALSSLSITFIRSNVVFSTAKVNKGDNTNEVSKQLYETGLFLFACPNYYCQAEVHSYIPNDPYFGKQFYLRNTGQTINDGHIGTPGIDINAANAWDITKGSSDIVIAVLDKGVTSDHPDLPNTRQLRLPGSNFAGGSSNDPSPDNSEDASQHGNACAGIIAATQDNNEGISGIAPNCKIMPIRIPFTGAVDPATYAGAILFAVGHGADVISNSWGYENPTPLLHPVIHLTIQFAINAGVVVVFSAGNSANHAGSDNGFVQFPANTGLMGLLTVGSCDRDGNQADYSPDGSMLDIVAPSQKAKPWDIAGETGEVWTMDSPGNAGANPCAGTCYSPSYPGEALPSSGTNYLSYSGRFGGTSASAPEVAGVVALMLSVNNCLTPLEIEWIIHTTAKKIGPFPYAGGNNDQFGFGLIDAAGAVDFARTKYLQHITETTDKDYMNHRVIAGFNVTPYFSTGNYTVLPGANISAQATQFVLLEPGFKAVNGSVFEATIVNDPPCDDFTFRMASSDTKENNTAREDIRGTAAAELNLYPNPSNGVITLTTSANEGVIEVYNMLGKKLESVVLKNHVHEYKLDLSAYSKGIFMVAVKSGSQVMTKKIIIE